MSLDSVIVIIEDQSPWRKYFEKILKLLGEERNIEKLDLEEFVEKYSDSSKFDNVACCWVDLELGPTSFKEMNDTLGLDQALPLIREYAPWIPVACISKFVSANPPIVGRLSVADFDGIFPKSIISEDGERTHPEFNAEKWNSILRDIQLKRIASMTCRTTIDLNRLLDESKELNVKLSGTVEIEVDKLGLKVFTEGLSLMNFHGKHIAVNEIEEGFSGVNVSRVRSFGQGDDGEGETESWWMMKWGTQVRKLSEEATAHINIFRRGLDRSLQIPLLHHNILYWEGIAYLAYAFEEGAVSALSFVKSENNISGLAEHIIKVTDCLYANSTSRPITPKDELIKWCCLNAEDLSMIGSSLLDQPLAVSTAFIHGDLHLRNIFIKSNGPTLIDFARAGNGPVVVDLAKLVIDTLVFFIPEEISQLNSLWSLKEEESQISKIISPFKRFLKADEDEDFFKLSILAYAIRYLKYPDVDKKVVKALKEAITSNISPKS